MLVAVICGLAINGQALNLPDQVDLRGAFTKYGLTVCNQKGPLCWDYAVVGVAEYELATQRNAATRLSPGFLAWAAAETDSESNAGSNFGRAFRGLEKFGLAPLNLGGNPNSEGRGQTPGQSTLRAAADLGRFDIRWIRFWDNHDELSDEQRTAIETEIADGHPVAVGMRWPIETKFSKADAYVLDVPERDRVFDGHCVALVGYRRDANLPGGGAFLFRNSWGEGWADHGYAWMPFALFDFCINDALSIRVRKPLKAGGFEARQFGAADLPVSTLIGPSPHAQDMEGFGPAWRGSQQLFFQADHVGQGFELAVPVEKAGAYELRLIITRAQDYGTFKVRVAGAETPSVPTIVDGAAPGVSRSNAIPCGRFNMKAGTNEILFTVTGKSSASSGMFIGVDAVQLVPAFD